MNYCPVPYESDYAMPSSQAHSTDKMGVSFMPPAGSTGPLSQVPLDPINSTPMHMNQFPMPMMSPINYPNSLGSMSMTPLAQAPIGSTQLPPGAMMPLNSVSQVPIMGGIDTNGMSAVLPEMSCMPGGQMQYGRMTGGYAAPFMQQSQPQQQPQQQQQPSHHLIQSSSNQLLQVQQPQQHHQHQQQQHQQSYQIAPNSPNWSNQGGNQYSGGNPKMNLDGNGMQQKMGNNNNEMAANKYSNMWSFGPSGCEQQQHQQQQLQHSNSSQQLQYRECRNGLNSPSFTDVAKMNRSFGYPPVNLKGKGATPVWRY